MTEKMVEHTFKKYCSANIVISQVYLTASAKHKIWYLWNPKKAVLRFCMMNDKKRILLLLKILDKIQEDNKNARKVEESITTICKEEVFLLNKYSLFCFLIL